MEGVWLRPTPSVTRRPSFDPRPLPKPFGGSYGLLNLAAVALQAAPQEAPQEASQEAPQEAPQGC